jgi:hypothetical protein
MGETFGAWLREHGPIGCLCQDMQQWCRRGMHKRCVCPHRFGQSTQAWLGRRDGSLVLNESTGGWWCLWTVPKPCRLHKRCLCNCHRPAKAKPTAIMQEPLFALSGAT